MESHVDRRLANLYRRAVICKAFPGSYTLRSLRDEPAWEPLYAIQLLDAAQKINS